MSSKNITVISLSKNDEKPVIPPIEADFEGEQLDQFRSLLCNNDNERNKLSNTFDLWDNLPRYAVSKQQMNKIRAEKGFLPLRRVQFQYKQRHFEILIQAARIYDRKANTDTDYYPSANEEIVEAALLKIAADHNNGFFEKPTFTSGVVFTLYMLREELKLRGHARSYQEIVLSLKIMAGSIVEIASLDGGESFSKMGYISELGAVSKDKLAEDPEAKWVVRFNPLVTRAINNLSYRQYNYAQVMDYKTQLARWLHKLLTHKFTFAGLTAPPFILHYSTVKRDSALLNGYTRERDAIAAFDTSLNELQESGVLMKVAKNEIRGDRGKLEDVVYTLTATKKFITEMKAANKRKNMAIEKNTK